MMTFQLVTKDKELLEEITHYLLEERLIANAMLQDAIEYLEMNDGSIESTKQYELKAISKSLLFNTINTKLRKKYGDKTPLTYCEPIIMIDKAQTEYLVEKLVKV